MISLARRSLRLAVAAPLLAAACASPEALLGTAYTTIELTNSRSMVRNHEPVEIPLTEVRARFRQFDERDFSVHLLSANVYPDRGDFLSASDPAPELPAQVIDKDLDGTPDTLLVICDFAAGEKRFVAVASPQFTRLGKKIGPRVNGGLFVRANTRREGGVLKGEGNYVETNNAVLDGGHVQGDGLYQCDGPLFETDTNGWRLLFDSRMCLDVIGKRERNLSFSADNPAFVGDFMDLSKQTWGGSLLGEAGGFGAGSFGFAEKRSVVPMAGFDSAQFRMIKDGPAAIEAEIVLFGARIGREAFDLRWRLTHYAGGRLMRHDVTITRGDHALAFAMNAGGLRKEEASGAQSWMRVSSFGPANVGNGVTGALGVGILANGRTATGFVNNPTDVIGVTFSAISRKLTFYTVAAWDQEPAAIRTAEEFQALMNELAVRLDSPIRVSNLDKAAGN